VPCPKRAAGFPPLKDVARWVTLECVLRRTLAVATASLALAGPAAAVGPAAHPTASARILKHCSPGFVHANMSWGEKCLHAGEFCKRGNPEYHRYGFTCPGSGHLAYYHRRKS